jgi:hypothetical protein
MAEGRAGLVFLGEGGEVVVVWSLVSIRVKFVCG